MNADQAIMEELNNKYNQLWKANTSLHGHGGAMPVFFISSLILFIYPISVLFTNNPNYYFIAIFWVLLIYSVYRGIKYLPKKHKLMNDIELIEKELFKSTGLNYCGCYLGGHFINKKTEQLWNIKEEILFDNHSIEAYKKWHNQWRYDPKWLIDNYSKIAITFVIINLCTTTYALALSWAI